MGQPFGLEDRPGCAEIVGFVGLQESVASVVETGTVVGDTACSEVQRNFGFRIPIVSLLSVLLSFPNSSSSLRVYFLPKSTSLVRVRHIPLDLAITISLIRRLDSVILLYLVWAIPA